MTAEIAILNRAAVAVAADSAVTLAGDAKVYKTANKIFPLSLDPLVIVMFYGAGELGSIPWETIVQEYKRLNTSSSFATIEEYGLHFIDFLPTMARHISPQTQTGFVRTEILWELERLVRLAKSSLGSHVREKSGTSTERLGFFLRQIQEEVQGRLDYLDDLGPVPGLTERVASRQLRSALDNWELLDSTVNDWNTLLDLWFSQLPELLIHGEGYLTRSIRRNIKRMTVRSLRTADWSPGATGLVVTGFGSEEIFPSLSHWIVDRVMDDVVKSRQLESVQISDVRATAILPFAQQHDVTMTLIDGIHPEFLTAHYEHVGRALRLLATVVSDEIQSVVQEPISSNLVDFTSRMCSEVIRTMPDELEMMIGHYSAPLLDLVQGLPKEHLGEMAETLVSLASFKEKFTPGADVVGGPIDVAVISRSDGLVWYRHKQYFNPRTASSRTQWGE